MYRLNNNKLNKVKLYKVIISLLLRVGLKYEKIFTIYFFPIQLRI